MLEVLSPLQGLEQMVRGSGLKKSRKSFIIQAQEKLSVVFCCYLAQWNPHFIFLVGVHGVTKIWLSGGWVAEIMHRFIAR